MDYKAFISIGKENKFDLLKINKSLELISTKNHNIEQCVLPFSEDIKAISCSYDSGLELYIIAYLNNNIYKCQNKTDALSELLKIKSSYIEEILEERKKHQLAFDKEQEKTNLPINILEKKIKTFSSILISAVDDLFENNYLDSFEKIIEANNTITLLLNEKEDKLYHRYQSYCYLLLSRIYFINDEIAKAISLSFNSLECDRNNYESYYQLSKCLYFAGHTNRSTWYLNYLIYQDSFFGYKVLVDADLKGTEDYRNLLIKMWQIYNKISGLIDISKNVNKAVNKILTKTDNAIHKSNDSISKIDTRIEEFSNTLENLAYELIKTPSQIDIEKKLNLKQFYKEIEKYKKLKTKIRDHYENLQYKRDLIHKNLKKIDLNYRLLKDILKIEKLSEHAEETIISEEIIPPHFLNSYKDIGRDYILSINRSINGNEKILCLDNNVKALGNRISENINTLVRKVKRWVKETKKEHDFLIKLIEQLNSQCKVLELKTNAVFIELELYVEELEIKINHTQSEIRNQTNNYHENYKNKVNRFLNLDKYIMLSFSIIYILAYLLITTLLNLNTISYIILSEKFSSSILIISDTIFVFVISILSYLCVMRIGEHIFKSQLDKKLIKINSSPIILELQLLSSTLEKVHGTLDSLRNLILDNTLSEYLPNETKNFAIIDEKEEKSLISN